MKCPFCGAEMSDLQKVELVDDSVNVHGRRQFTLRAEHKENISWDGEKYKCSRCGNTFSFQEGVLQ